MKNKILIILGKIIARLQANPLLPSLFLLLIISLFLLRGIYLYAFLVRHPEPWSFYAHFFFWPVLLAFLRFSYFLLSSLTPRYYTLPPPGDKEIYLLLHWQFFFPELLSRISSSWNLFLEKLFLLWLSLPRGYFLGLSLIPRMALFLSLVWDFFFRESLFLFHQFLPLLIIPLFLKVYLWSMKQWAKSRWDLFGSLVDVKPSQSEKGLLDFSYTQKAWDLGYRDEAQLRELADGLFFWVKISKDISDFYSFRRKYSQPFNLYLSLGYLLIWLLFFYKIFLS